MNNFRSQELRWRYIPTAEALQAEAMQRPSLEHQVQSLQRAGTPYTYIACLNQDIPPSFTPRSFFIPTWPFTLDNNYQQSAKTVVVLGETNQTSREPALQGS